MYIEQSSYQCLTIGFRQNVEYVEMSVPLSVPLQLCRFLPNVFYSTWSSDHSRYYSIASGVFYSFISPSIECSKWLVWSPRQLSNQVKNFIHHI